MREMESKRYMTIKELMGKAVERARRDPLFVEAEKLCELDYDKIAYSVGEDKLYRCQFDAISSVTFGSSEGIYGTIQLLGCWTKEHMSQPMYTRVNVYTLKTLAMSENAYIGIGMMGNLIAYHATQYIMENLNRFDA